jgi:DNA-directed RNA polymerase specialized sigma24 family protein
LNAPRPPVYTEYFPHLCRFALLVTGDEAKAGRIVDATVTEAMTRVAHWDFRRARRWLFVNARKNYLQIFTPAGSGALAARELNSQEVAQLREVNSASLASLFGALGEPHRSAAALFYLGIFTPEGLAEVLNFNVDTLATVLAEARAALFERARRTAATPAP